VKTHILVALLCLAGCAGGESAVGTAGSGSPVLVRFASGPAGGGFLPLGEQLVRAFSEGRQDLEIRLLPSAGAVANIKAIQHGDAEIGFTFADVAFMAFTGQLGDGAPAFDQLRGIAVLQVTPAALVVRPGLSIDGPGDLRGRSVGVGPPGSGTAITAQLILRAFGVEETAVRVDVSSFQDASAKLLSGELDAMFDNAISQSPSLKRAAAAGARFVPIEGPPADQLRRDYPFLTATTIPEELYGVSVHTIGVDGLLICRSDLDEAVVYELTRRLFLSLKSLGRGALRLMDVGQAPATPIPLHAGAARYYRERELSR
jgi:TRAP transporter TAXI family solute receptor